MQLHVALAQDIRLLARVPRFFRRKTSRVKDHLCGLTVAMHFAFTILTIDSFQAFIGNIFAPSASEPLDSTSSRFRVGL